jgi:Acetyltransferases, including N-acetylases of ribosomal proteins
VNDPEVREASFFPEYISLESHKQWFREKMNNPYSFLFIGIDENNNPIGQVRFDIEGDQAETSISINGQYRGRGYGSILITKGIDQLSNISYINSFDAYIKPENIKSKRTFIESGFIPQGEKVIKNKLLYT